MASSNKKATIQLKDGAQSALSRLNDVLGRRRIETILIKQEADSNCSGWSVDDTDDDEETTTTSDPSPIPTEDCESLFKAIGRVDSLKELILDYYANPIPIKALSTMFNQSRTHGGRIEKLSLRHVNFLGEIPDFHVFAEAILSQHTLLKVHMTSCKTQCMETSAPIVDAISSVHSLNEITLEEMKTTGESLVSLFRLPNLRTLNLRHISACNAHMTAIANALERNTSLEHLQIRYALDRDASLAIFQMLQENSSLQSVDIDMDCWDDYGQALADALIANRILQDLELNVYGNDDHVEANALALAGSMSKNTSLKRLCLTFHNRRQQNFAEQGELLGRLSAAFVGPFSNVMKKNFALGILEVGLVHRRVLFNEVVRYYLKLNGAGRKELVLLPNTSSRKQWIETLIAYRDDLNVLYYFLSMNPSITEDSDDGLFTEPHCKRLKMETSARTMG